MAVPYNHKAIEKKWKEKWAENPVNPKVDENGHPKKKDYCLDMFPYPSGNGLHVGLERLCYLRCVEPLQTASGILHYSSDGMGCIRPSG